jgi:hypothetical protein
VNRKFLVGMLGALLWAGLARAQGNLDGSSLPAPQEQGTEHPTAHFLSDFITFANRDHVPIPVEAAHVMYPVGTEPFFRVGPSTPFGSGTFAATLDTGWMLEGGVRALFYNEPHDRAWVVEGSISNAYNSANSTTANHSATINILQNGVFNNQTVTIHDLNQTFVNLGFGHDWYCWHSPESGKSLRFGIDAGGRWGTAKADFNEIPHRTGMLFGAYGAIHADLLIPCGGCFSFVCGVRGEYDIMQNSNLLQETETLQGMSLMFNFGLRF